MAKKKNVNVRLVAEKCGVSTATISRVLNADPKVAEATRQKVMEALKELDYKPVEKTGNSYNKVAVITRVSHQDYYVSLVHEINKYMAGLGYDVVSLSQENNLRSLPELLETAYSSNISGVIIVSADYSSIKNQLLPSIPHVWIDCNDEPENVPDICTVESDHYISGRLAAHALLNQNCTSPIIITGNNPSRRSAERKQGFFDEFKEAGLTLSNDNIIEVQTGTDGFTVTREAVRYAIAKGSDFDSIFAISDWRALGAYSGVITMGKKVPEDIRIIGFDGLSLACKTVGITSIQQNTARLAQCSCDQLLTLIRGEDVQEKHIVIPTGILQGQTLPEPNIMSL